MKYLITLLILANLIFSQSDDNQSFKLKDGSVVVGTIQNETDTEIEVLTKFGLVEINKSFLIQTQYEVKLNSGETLIGTKVDNGNSIILNTSIGELTIQKSDIINISEVGKVTSEGKQNKNNSSSYRRPYSMTDFLFGTSKIDKDIDFVLGEEQLTDLFFDPTGYTFKQSTLYLSGLSFGFGVTDNLQITTKWGGFFYGNLNLRPKYKVFEKGNWEKQHALSIGAHYHTRWMPNKYEWKSGNLTTDNGEKYWGGYYRIDENPIYEIITSDWDPTYQYLERTDDDENGETFNEMIELFGAYTYSKARAGLKGRISHTLGGNLQYISLNDKSTVLYRAYYGLDVDINSKLKMIGELFYDPYFLELWQQFEYEDNYYNLEELSDTKVDEPDNYKPIHLDFGFIYAVNESFRFGIHFQKPFIAFYWKL